MIQVIKCKNCGTQFAGCTEPHCYTDKEWLKDLRKYVLQGHKVEMIDESSVDLSACTCMSKPKKEPEPDLFNE